MVNFNLVGYVRSNITAKAALKLGSEAWVLKKREEQRLEAAQMKFLRHLLGITKLYKRKNQCIRQKKKGSTEHSKGNNNNNNIYLTAIGLSPGGSGFIHIYKYLTLCY